VVQYLDFDKDELPDFLLAKEPCFLKRKSFAHERELRAATIISHATMRQLVSEPPRNEAPGQSVPCELTRLLKKVYVSPTAPGWFARTVKAALKRYSLGEITVTQSDLDRDPVY